MNVTTWEKDYKGLQVKVSYISYPKEAIKKLSKFGLCDKEGWFTSYIIIPVDIIPDSMKKHLFRRAQKTQYGTFFDYTTDFFYSLQLHGGITFYTRNISPYTKKTVSIEIGCDYNHLWDKGKDYSAKIVMDEIKASADILLERLKEGEEK